MRGMLPPGGAVPVQVTSCSSSTIVHVTVPPVVMVTLDGVKASSTPCTVADDAGAAVTITDAVAVHVRPSEENDAETVVLPGAIAVTTPPLATPALVASATLH